MTLEDETGLVNVVVWQKILEKYELLANTQGFLGVTGRLQIEGGVVHLVAEEFWAPDLGREPAKATEAGNVAPQVHLVVRHAPTESEILDNHTLPACVYPQLLENML